MSSLRPVQLDGGPVFGASCVIPVPGSEACYRANYAFRELADLRPSHDGWSFRPNPEYELRNERNYATPLNAERVLQHVENFNPEYLVNTNPDAVNGPPIVDERGNVLGGNGRLMVLQRVYGSRPGPALEYRALLAGKARQFGLRSPHHMQQPVLVRVLISGYSPEAAIADFNRVGTATLTPAERALADARRISPETLDYLAGEIAELGDDGTLARLLASPRGVRVLERLVEDGVISPAEKAGYFERGQVTPEARQRLTRLTVGRLFADPEDYERAPADLRGKLERIVASLARVEDRPDWSLTSLTREAVAVISESRTRRVSLAQLADQTGLFTGGQGYQEPALRIARTLLEPALMAAAAFRRYAAEGNLARSGGLLAFIEPPTPQAAFEAAFGTPFGAEKRSAGSGNKLELNPHLFDNKDRREKNPMTTINLVRDGDLAKHASFDGPNVRVVFDRKKGWSFSHLDPVFTVQSSSFADLNSSLAERGCKLRFVGGGAGPKTLQLVAD